jgi:hypothetical protein
MSNGSLAIHSGHRARRSTRVNRVIQLAVSGVDSYRGPYHEEVSTITVNCHGCKYESKHEVLANAYVELELTGKGQDAKPISARGRVRWTQRPTEIRGMFQTAIELDEPSNLWGIDSPPSDWLPFCVPRKHEADESKAKTVAVLLSEVASIPTKEERRKAAIPRRLGYASPPSPDTRPVGQLIGGFQQQLERMLSEAAQAVVRERATAVLNDIRAGLREEAERIVAEAISSQAGAWIDQSLKRMNQIGEESAQARHAQWTKKIEMDLQWALARMETRHRELEEVSETLTTKTHERLQGVLEGCGKDAVNCIIARLTEESAPVIDHARKVAADLAKREVELERICQQSVERSTAQIEQSYMRFDKHFEEIVRERLAGAREELDRVASAAANSALVNVRASAQQQVAEAQARFSTGVEPLTEGVLEALKEKAAEISRHFVGEISHFSRSHLEFVSGGISELAKGIGKLSKD